MGEYYSYFFTKLINIVHSLYRSSIQHLTLINQGKVRDIYHVDDQHMLIVTTDRLSAFDVILPDPVPLKGKLLTEVSTFWFERFASFVPNHLTEMQLSDVLSDKEIKELDGRAQIVKKLKPLPIEAVARGYLIGSGWKDYQANQTVCGIALPEGVQQVEKLSEPIFTPATKAAVGDHDENIDFQTTIDLVGETLANKIKEITLKIYQEAVDYAASKGIIIADTKLEFGLDDSGELVLIDEVLTPDSSRFWPADSYQLGISPPSFDKQFVRDYLETLDWNKTAPGPRLPQEVLLQTASKYKEARDRLIQ